MRKEKTMEKLWNGIEIIRKEYDAAGGVWSIVDIELQPAFERELEKGLSLQEAIQLIFEDWENEKSQIFKEHFEKKDGSDVARWGLSSLVLKFG